MTTKEKAVGARKASSICRIASTRCNDVARDSEICSDDNSKVRSDLRSSVIENGQALNTKHIELHTEYSLTSKVNDDNVHCSELLTFRRFAVLVTGCLSPNRIFGRHRATFAILELERLAVDLLKVPDVNCP